MNQPIRAHTGSPRYAVHAGRSIPSAHRIDEGLSSPYGTAARKNPPTAV
jgi:hypothetical protein